MTDLPRYRWFLEGRTGLIRCEKAADGAWLKVEDVSLCLQQLEELRTWEQAIVCATGQLTRADALAEIYSTLQQLPHG